MKNKGWNIHGSVITIGSLYWQDYLNKQSDNIRKKWRERYLGLEIDKTKILVKLPIRYGRYSKNKVYTMVFSANCEKQNKLGTGYVIPFLSNPINDFYDIEFETRQMSIAEGMKGRFEELGTSINKSTRKKSREKVDFF